MRSKVQVIERVSLKAYSIPGCSSAPIIVPPNRPKTEVQPVGVGLLPLTQFTAPSRIKRNCNALFPVLEHTSTDLFKLLMIVDVGAAMKLK